MFGLHGLVTPDKEESLKTNGGLMYYQYNGGNSVTELINRNGDEIEHYRYDAFGNIYTGITSPYNTTGYTGQDYDDLSGLIQMDARWYDSSIGRFTTQDSYMGDVYTSQSLNRYAYVMNNPVNMWDPTGHVPEWVGDEHHINYMDNSYQEYRLIDNWNSSSGWELSDKITTDTEITYKYKATIENTWVYNYWNIELESPTDQDSIVDRIRIDLRNQLRIMAEISFGTPTTVTYSQTDSYYNDVVTKASDIAVENEQYIKNLAGDPPKNTDPPAESFSTVKIGAKGSMNLHKPKDIIVSTELKQKITQSLKTDVVQSEIYNIMNKNPKLGRWNDDPTVNKLSLEFQGDGPMAHTSKNNKKTNGKKGTVNLVTAKQLKKFGWSDTSNSFVKKLNATLTNYGITDKNSIALFMATMAEESGWGTKTIEQGSDDYFAKKKYGKNGRGAGYIQITSRDTHLKFLKTMDDNFSGADTAKHIADKYPMEAAAWFWSNAAKTGEGNLNAYVKKNGDSLGIFLNTQYFVNGLVTDEKGNVPKEFMDDLTSIRQGGAFKITSNSLIVNGNTWRLPTNWDSRKNAYDKAIKAFK